MLTPQLVEDFKPNLMEGSTKFLYDAGKIPNKFYAMNDPYHMFISSWFFNGLRADSELSDKFILKDEFKGKRVRCNIFPMLKSHLMCKQLPNGESLDHNWKISNVAYLMSQIFDYID